MRNTLWIIVSVLFLSLCSCGGDEHFRIGVSQCSRDDWRKKMNEEIEREIMLHPGVEVEIRSADDSNEKQIADIRYFADNGFDIIIAAPNEADAITPVIKEVYESGIPVIIFDRNINGDTYTAFQGADNMGIGRAAAQYARHLLPGGRGTVIELEGLPGSTPAIERHKGFEEEASGLDVLVSLPGNWNYEDTEPLVDSLLDRYPDVNLIYAHNDRMALAASDVARAKGLNPHIVGVDAAPEIGIQAVADGRIDATFLYPTEGHRLVRTALAILKGEPYDSICLVPTSSAVDHTNADILLLQNESIIEETSKVKALKTQVDEYWTRHSIQSSLLYATVAIVVLLAFIVFILFRTYWQSQKHQAVLVEHNRQLAEERDKQRELNERLAEATQSKLVFFTNVSHDLRTPLTLISEPVEQLATATNLTPQQSALVKIANKNVKILRRLINQILDFRKYENGKLDVNLSETNLSALVREWTDAFAALARKRDIDLKLDVAKDADISLAIDVEKIERVFYNLVSNAFKYTPDNGKINISMAVDAEGKLRLSVADTGTGIAAEDLGKVFDRFFQVDRVHPKGSGIGLSLAKAFVELHGGTISAASEPGKGATFTVLLPIRHTDVAASDVPEITDADVRTELEDIETNDMPHDAEKPTLLVIDDNADLRKMLAELMAGSYNVATAVNGAEGIKMAAKYVPDLIICDMVMPVMDGLECVRRLKSELSTSHIPVLMLTACSLDEQRIEGYESGVDGYLAKPFNSEMLQVRCRNLIENRRRIASPLSRAAEPVASTDSSAKAPVGDIDSEFYTRFLDIVNEKMGDPDLNVDSLAGQMGLGRSQFYRKIKALTNYSPVELLRRLRLERARKLLTASEKSISEIAYEVGFSTPAYFTKCYREAYGSTPSDLRQSLG